MTCSPLSEALFQQSAPSRTEINQLSTGQPPVNKTDARIRVGPWQAAIPRSIWVDPLLDAIDIRCWGLIRTQVASGSAVIVSLNQRLENQLPYSRATISKVIAVLRLTRWISLCPAQRRPSTGQFQGHVYAVHDAPCDVNEALCLDEDYRAFVQQQMAHKDGRIRRIAHTVWHNIEALMAKGSAHRPQADAVPVYPPYQATVPVYYVNLGMTKYAVDPVQRGDTDRAQKMDRVENHRVQNVNPEGNGQVQILNRDENDRVQKMNTVPKTPKSQEKQPVDRHVQNLNPAIDNRCSCSSSYINIINKTTTTNTGKIEKTVFERIPLVFPDEFKLSERHLVEHNLAGIDPDLRQALLDEAAAQIQARRKTSNPIRNPVGYLAWMCNAHRTGLVVLTSLGIRYRENREKQANLDGQVQEQKRQPVPGAKPAVQVATRRVDYKDRIQALRDGLRTGKNNQDGNVTYPGQLGAMGYGGQSARVAV